MNLEPELKLLSRLLYYPVRVIVYTMSRTACDLVVSPPFYEALSGRFQVPGSNDRYNLARVAVSTYLKGENTDGSSESAEGLERWSYRIEWAPRALATVVLQQTDGLHIAGLRLDQIFPGRRKLEPIIITEEPTDDGKSVLEVTVSNNTRTLPLEPWGEALGAAQAEIAAVAQVFFSRL